MLDLDFTYGFNEPLTETYFWHPAYDDYPVVGVSWAKSGLQRLADATAGHLEAPERRDHGPEVPPAQ